MLPPTPADAAALPTDGTPVAGGTGNQPDYKALYEATQKEAETWRNRFTGLQTKYQQEQTKWAGDSAKVLDLGEQLKALTGEKEVLSLNLQQITEKQTSAEGEAELLKGQLERMKIVTTEFPHLVPFMADDLIPDALGEELRTKLKAFSEKITGLKAADVQKQIAGASPVEPPSGIKNTPRQILQQAVEAMRAGNVSEYEKLYSQYLDANKGE